MKRKQKFSGPFCLAIALLAASSAVAAEKSRTTIDFNRDIRPIFSENCYACHGPDHNKRKAGLRLDRSEEPFKVLESGKTAIIPNGLGPFHIQRSLGTVDIRLAHKLR